MPWIHKMKTGLPLILGKAGLSLLLFAVALSYEEASPERLTFLLLLFALFMGWGFARPFFLPHFLLFLVDGVILYLMEYESKYVINYFLHSLYIMVLLEAGFLLSRKMFDLTFLLLAPLSMAKFVYLLLHEWNGRTISEFLFNLFALLFMAALIHAKEIHREAMATTQELYRELLDTYKKLKEERKRAEEAVLLRERTRIAREIHDRVGHHLTGLILQLEMLSLEGERNEKLERIKEMARLSLAETRKAVHALSGEEKRGMKGILEFIERFRRLHPVSIKLNLSDAIDQVLLTPEQSLVLFRLLQESLTNATKHSKGEEVTITLLHGEGNRLHFHIKNALLNEGEIREGFGLSAMRERVEEAGGRFSYFADGGYFHVEGFLPLRQLSEEE
ncbi:sensor histidine kinase [Thermicanus aegyptius]|uniref:sensor histidine kinase n=1 Tax=Thermicanus aegyptius TaxID=94009 RepID=UPI00040556DF|nr:histidine kinase [Thermicanus aegyptius]